MSSRVLDKSTVSSWYDNGCNEDKNNLQRQILNPQLKLRGPDKKNIFSFYFSFLSESAFDRSFHLDDQTQINNARLTASNNTATGGLGMKKKKPLYSHLHQPAVYQEHKVHPRITMTENKSWSIKYYKFFLQSTVLLKKRRQTEPLSLPSVSGASKLHVEGKMTLQISGCSDHRMVWHVD